MRQAKRPARQARYLLVVLPAALVWAPALLFAWGQDWFSAPVQAQEPPDMSIQIKGGYSKGLAPPGPLSPPAGCNTRTISVNQCGALVNAPFTVMVLLNNVGLTDGDDDGTAGYTGIQVRINVGDDVGSAGKNREGTSELGPDMDPFWPECDQTTIVESGSESYAASCNTATVGTDRIESVHTGLLMEQDYFCSPGTKHTITLKHGTNDSYVLDDTDGKVLAGSGVEEITVVCELAPKDPTVDTDQDGCTDVAEQQQKSQAATGGGRDQLYYWDFMDMWVNKDKDRRVNIIDVGAIVNRFFTAGDPGGDPLDPPQDLTSYHVSADRSPPIGANPWNAGPPDGDINIIEIGLVVAQFGHNCSGSP